MKRKVTLDEVLKKHLKDKEFQVYYDEKRFYLQIAHLITELRSKEGLSQAELAARTGVSQPLIARLEKGDQSRTPTFDMIYRVIKVLGYTMSLSIKPQRKRAA